MKPYSQDLRERVVAAVEAGQSSQSEIAATFAVSDSTIDKWMKRWRATRSVAALPFAGGRERVLKACAAVIRAEVQHQPDVTLAELCERVVAQAEVTASRSMMTRELQILALPRKKKMIHDSERDTPRVIELRANFAIRVKTELADLLPRLKFLDEFGVNLGLTRLYGRAAPGERVVEATPGTSGPHYTGIATLGVTGVQAPLLFEGAMTTLIFETYVDDVLAPTLQSGEILMLDNLSAHKGGQAQAILEARGVRVIFLPPYSPDLNPIEKCWAKVKQALRAAKARTWDDLVDALAKALRSVSPGDVLAWFNHCGYKTA